MKIALQLLFLVFLTLINAFFAASEMAFVSMRKSRVQQLKHDGVGGAAVLYEQMQQPNRFLSTIQVGITLAGFFASASAASNLSDDGAWLLQQLSIPYPQQVAFVLITVLLSYFTLVFGELFPKNVALQYKEIIALKTAGIIRFISGLTAPFVSLLSMSTQLLMKIFGIPLDQKEEPITRDALRKMVDTGRKQGNIDKDEEFLISRVIDLDEIYIREIMHPRDEIFSLDIERWQPQLIDDIIEAGFSRIPVYRRELDEVLGFLHIKDLLVLLHKNTVTAQDILANLREAHVVSDNKYIDNVLRYFQREKVHIALVVDEYGIIKGMVTIEDILEEIVGEIDDEFDAPESNFQVYDLGYRVKGNISLHNLNRQLGSALHSDNAETLNGYLTERFEREQLALGQTVSVDNYHITVEKRNKRKIQYVYIEKQRD